MYKNLNIRFIWIIFIVSAAAQLLFPILSIIEKNDILASGMEFKIQTQPIDPADPFRGRYVAISVVADIAESAAPATPVSHDTCYIRLQEGADGYAQVSEISDTPLHGDGILKLHDVYISTDGIRLPYDRYYMRESAAPKAEAAYRERRDAYVTLRVKNAKGVVSGLYLDGMPAEEYIKGMEASD